MVIFLLLVYLFALFLPFPVKRQCDTGDDEDGTDDFGGPHCRTEYKRRTNHRNKRLHVHQERSIRGTDLRHFPVPDHVAQSVYDDSADDKQQPHRHAGCGHPPIIRCRKERDEHKQPECIGQKSDLYRVDIFCEPLDQYHENCERQHRQDDDRFPKTENDHTAVISAQNDTGQCKQCTEPEFQSAAFTEYEDRENCRHDRSQCQNQRRRHRVRRDKSQEERILVRCNPYDPRKDDHNPDPGRNLRHREIFRSKDPEEKIDRNQPDYRDAVGVEVIDKDLADDEVAAPDDDTEQENRVGEPFHQIWRQSKIKSVHILIHP